MNIALQSIFEESKPMNEIHEDDSIEIAAEKVGANLRKSVRQAKVAVRDGADAVDDALHPSFTESLADAVRDISDDPKDAPTIVRDLLRAHPVAGTLTLAATAVVAHRLLSTLLRR